MCEHVWIHAYMHIHRGGGGRLPWMQKCTYLNNVMLIMIYIYQNMREPLEVDFDTFSLEVKSKHLNCN